MHTFSILMAGLLPNAKIILSEELFKIYLESKDKLLDSAFTKNEETSSKVMDTLDILDAIVDTFTPEEDRQPHGTIYSPEDLVKMVKLLDFELKDKCLECIKQNIERINK